MEAAAYKRAVMVWIFIFIALGIFVAGVLTLGNARKTFTKVIRIKAVFDDVGGLKAGGNVWFSGVKIGTVSKIAFSGTSQVEVIMNIEQQSKQYIRKNAKSKIGTDGLIGNKIIVIYGGTPEVPEVEEGDVLAVEKIAGTDEMMATLQDNNVNLKQITTDFKEISKKLAAGEGTIGKLLSDERLLNEMHAVMANFRRVSGNAEKITMQVSGYTAKLQQQGSMTNDLLTDTVIFNRLRTTVTQLDEVSRQAGLVMNDFKTVSESLKNRNSPVGILLNDEEAASNLKQTLQNLQTGTEKLDENMEALQHNFLLRGFFRRKARNEAKAEATDSLR